MANKKSSKKTATDAAKYKRERELANARNRKYKASMSAEKLEEKRKRDRERYHRLKEEKKIQLVAEMSEKEKKKARKLWREKKAALRKKEKLKQALMIDTPPHSDSEEVTNEENIGNDSRQKEVGRKKVRKDRAKAYRDLKKEKTENERLRAKIEKYKKRWQRERARNKNISSSPSPNTKMRNLQGFNSKISPQIKKRLFLSYAMEKQLKFSIKKTKPKSKARQIVTKAIGTQLLRKYRVQRELLAIVPYKCNNKISDGDTSYNRKMYTTVKVREAVAIRKFYLNDLVSKMMPGKKDFVKKGGVKMQRRVLLDTLENLHTKFIEETNFQLSYTTFTRCRPFWVQKPTLKDRETCACSKHENIQLLVTALNIAKVIVFSNAHEALKSLVCTTSSQDCMDGKCSNCCANEIFFDDDGPQEIKLSQWENISETKLIKGKEKVIKKVLKVTKNYEISEVKKMFKSQMINFKKHVFAMKHQANKLNKVTKELQAGELLFQIDFSQNYVAKCSQEIQSMHFGASKPQISLHTGVMHYVHKKQVLCDSFCTVSDNIDHMAYAVWAHLQPILEKAAKDFPDTKKLTFFSDSPSSQYRNKTNVYFMRKMLPTIFTNLKSFSWNFSEPGHGKGAMDGVGGSIKRNADKHVLHGKDIMSAKDLVSVFKKSSTLVTEILSEKIVEYKNLIPENLPVIKGIMGIRQLFWEGGDVHGRKLSCFECRNKCSHFHVKFIPNFDTENPNKSQKVGKKIKLKVSDFYSSDSSDSETPPEPCDNNSITFNTNIKFSELKAEAFVVVEFEMGRGSKNFLAVLQGEVSDDREVEVLFLKETNDGRIFRPNENDIAWVGCDQIVGILPKPELVTRRNDIFYKFKNIVSF